MIKKGTLTFPEFNCLIGFDAEWTKNYKIVNGNIPFCFSIVAVRREDLSFYRLENGDVPFRYVQFYCKSKEEASDLVTLCNPYMESIIESLSSCILCGHQVSSDFSVLFNYGKANALGELRNIEKLQRMWHMRKSGERICIVDTRYDVTHSFMGKSRRLVDMCNDFLLDVRQPELRNTSMTKLQNTFLTSGDYSIYERIAVMNIRHSLCAAVLYWLNDMICEGFQTSPININRTVYQTLKDDFQWVASSDFLKLL